MSHLRIALLSNVLIHSSVGPPSSILGLRLRDLRSGLAKIVHSENLENINPLKPMSDQDRISPYNINAISSREVMRIKKKYQLGDDQLMQYQIL